MSFTIFQSEKTPFLAIKTRSPKNRKIDIFPKGLTHVWVTFLAETSKDLEIILIIIVLSFTNRLSRTSLYLSLKTSFVYSNLFSLAKTVTIRCYIQTGKRVRSPSSACKKARATAKKLQSINHFTIAACGNVIEFHSVLLFIDPSRLILMDSVICLSIASPW